MKKIAAIIGGALFALVAVSSAQASRHEGYERHGSHYYNNHHGSSGYRSNTSRHHDLPDHSRRYVNPAPRHSRHYYRSDDRYRHSYYGYNNRYRHHGLYEHSR